MDSEDSLLSLQQPEQILKETSPRPHIQFL
jgi:hypothetical protein